MVLRHSWVEGIWPVKNPALAILKSLLLGDSSHELVVLTASIHLKLDCRQLSTFAADGW